MTPARIDSNGNPGIDGCVRIVPVVAVEVRVVGVVGVEVGNAELEAIEVEAEAEVGSIVTSMLAIQFNVPFEYAS